MTSNNYSSDDLDKLFFYQINKSINNSKSTILSSAALEDKLVQTISSSSIFELNENVIHIKWHYLDQAEALLYRINICDPIPEFVIFSKDLPEELIQELTSLNKPAMKKIITNVVRRIYESVDPDYFHTNGIYGKVRWRFAS